MHSRRSNSSASNDKIVTGTHAAHRLHDILLIVRDDLHPLQLDAETEAELGQEGRVGIDCLEVVVSAIHL